MLGEDHFETRLIWKYELGLVDVNARVFTIPVLESMDRVGQRSYIVLWEPAGKGLGSGEPISRNMGEVNMPTVIWWTQQRETILD